MRFLADENLETLIIEKLQADGHDVATIPAPEAGIDDQVVLARTLEQRRILLTNDKDFAELAFFQGSAAAGIVLIRLARLRTAEKAERVLEVVRERRDRLWHSMTVIEEEAARVRALPVSPG